MISPYFQSNMYKNNIPRNETDFLCTNVIFDWVKKEIRVLP